MSISADALRIQVIRQHIRKTVTPQNLRYLRRNPIQRQLCQSLGFTWYPQMTPLINAAMQLEGYQLVLLDGKKYYKNTQYTNPSVSE